MRSQSESFCLALLAALVFLMPAQGSAEESRMRVCTKEYLANKAAIEARGLTEKDYVADCLLRPANAAAPAPAAPAPAATAAPKAPAVETSKTFPWVVVASMGQASQTRLGGYEDRDKCMAAAKAIRINLKKATEVAKVDCAAGGTLAAGAPK